MRKINFSLTALAFLLAVAGAFAFKPASLAPSASPAYEESLYWYNTANTYVDQNIKGDQFTPGSEVAITGCHYSNSICEKGYRQDQLNNPSDPSQGVKTTQLNSPAETIFKQ